MMDEAIDVLVPLLRGEVVTAKTDWFTLNDARLQLPPYTRPHVEICVASQVSPAGARAAGKHGLGLLSIGATSTGGFNALASELGDLRAAAPRSSTATCAATSGASSVRCTSPRRASRRSRTSSFGLEKWLYYFQRRRGAAARAGRRLRERRRRDARLRASR